ncbi:phospholipase effector Tle1 domain-containing protein [Pseudomonas sp. GZD-222]|uniref:phospholipase effector Tle1 domain-containing protein n=1 Tax=Pseudomonas sp. GZD-222 TaxID=3404805 RepID=UPI003BB5DB0F
MSFIVDQGDVGSSQANSRRSSVTLHVGVFFDGTGNNLSNSEAAADCMDPVKLASSPALRKQCASYGYNGQGSVPADSYGTAKSNIAKLYELYRDQAAERLQDDQKRVSLKVYAEGIGTQAGKKDSDLSKLTGRYASGVITRVQQVPAAILEQLARWSQINPGVRIQQVELDIFGFSRGAAAARHFANDIGRGAASLLAQRWPASLLAEGFDWQSSSSLAINFIGLFDSVAAVVSVFNGNFSPANADYGGIEMKLPQTAAKKIVHLVARDEHRKNFPLTQCEDDSVVPGAHSDVGGGYLPHAWEHLVLTRPVSSIEAHNRANEKSRAYLQTQAQFLRNQKTWQQLNLEVELCCLAEVYQPAKRDTAAEKRVTAFVRGKREMVGDLALVYMRIMHRLGVDHSVPFEALDEQRMALPASLQPIAAKLMAYVSGSTPALALSEEDETLLCGRYIHLSSHWSTQGTPREGIDSKYINRPHESGQRSVYPNA